MTSSCSSLFQVKRLRFKLGSSTCRRLYRAGAVAVAAICHAVQRLLFLRHSEAQGRSVTRSRLLENINTRIAMLS